MKFEHNGQTLTGTAEEILQQLTEQAQKEYEFRYAGTIYYGTETEIKRQLLQNLHHESIILRDGFVSLGEESDTHDSSVIRLNLISKALARVELYCLEPKNEI